MKTLLVFDWFGEADLAFFVIEDAPEWLTKCHQEFINERRDDSEVDAFLTRVNDAICSNPEHYSDPDDDLAGAWAGKRVAMSGEVPVIEGSFQIVVCGFVP